MADRNPKADGMSWLNPYMVVKDVEKSLEFYEKAFGFEKQMTMPDKEGTIVHAEMKVRDCTIMLGAESEEWGTKSPKTLAGSPVSFYIYVDDIEKAFKKAETAGATTIQEPKDQFWGDRTCHVRCPEGHEWTLAQNVGEFDPSKAES